MVKENVIGKLGLYYDLAGDVRYTNSKVPIRQLVTPDDPEVREVADILHKTPDFITACQDFVHSFTTYGHEPWGLLGYGQRNPAPASWGLRLPGYPSLLPSESLPFA